MGVHPWGLRWAWATANGYDAPFLPLLAQGDGQLMVRTAPGCPATTGAPAHRPGCLRGPWHTRRRVATGWARRPAVFQSKPVGQRVGRYCCARVAWPRAACKLLARWARAIDDENRVRLSMAACSL